MDLNKSATRLSRNPLGIITLFILLIYGFAALLFEFSGNVLEPDQKWWFTIFLVVFPVFVVVSAFSSLAGGKFIAGKSCPDGW